MLHKKIKALENELKEVAFSEERAPANKGQWREKVFKKDATAILDLEIGTGIGHHFAYYAHKFPERNLIGIEIKYWPYSGNFAG